MRSRLGCRLQAEEDAGQESGEKQRGGDDNAEPEAVLAGVRPPGGKLVEKRSKLFGNGGFRVFQRSWA